MHTCDTRMVQLSSGPCISQEKFGLMFIQLALTRDFDSNCALKLGIAGFPYTAKAARTNFVHQLEAAEHFNARTIRAGADCA